jgi:3'-phosphoadenosine 5'-phosphosulfate sulfotransferase (PAPS reductase)/FAD synthetase
VLNYLKGGATGYADLSRCASLSFGWRAAIGTSSQGVGLVMLHLCQTHGFEFPVFALDTKLLFPETLEI